ncbi:hypothetical protein [Winogradskyella forsetii]|uniref:hypothetical protein n=1 Tax=Winogradskyella forsetii TaxID=2686077 RepID=UPI0015BEB9D3|nr:hypothetical protein [Winogradskyella forsetii]
MNAIIATILKDKLGDLSFIDKKAGLVHVAEKTSPTEIEGAFAVSKFPISNDVDFEQCFNSGCYKDLVPNSKNKGIIYFEDINCIPLEFASGKFFYRSKIRLVCWINNKLIQGNNCKSISHLLITQIRRQLEIGYFNQDNITRIFVRANNIVPNEYKLFEKYNYPKDVLKYLMHPYEAFGIDFNVDFSISENCLPELIIESEVC